MGKKKRSRDIDRTPSKPDDIIDVGPVRIARYGEIVHIDNRLTADEHESGRARIAEMFPQVCSDISTCVESIRAIVASHNPIDLLRRAFLMCVVNRLGLQKESDLETAHGVDQRMLDYIHSVVLSTEIAEDSPDISDAEWDELRAYVDDLFKLLNVQFFASRSAVAAQEDNYDQRLDDLYTWELMHRYNVRGARYVVHERSHLLDLLGPHSLEIERQYGLTSDQFVDDIMKIIDTHLKGTPSCYRELERLQAELFERTDGDVLEQRATQIGAEAAIREAAEELGLLPELVSCADKAFGFGLFDLQNICDLPSELIDDLSMGPGEDHSYFDGSEYSGWPIQYRTTLDKPFLRVHGRYYCFDIYTLLDGLYRAMGKLIRTNNPSYAETWNQLQKEASESVPLDLLSGLLPGATVIPSCYYEYLDEDTGKLKWAETDGVILFDDVLLVVEVKAGAFLTETPSPDMEAYLRSVQEVLFDPGEQGYRLIHELRRASTVSLYQTQGKRAKRTTPLLELDHSLVRECYVVAISVDQLTEIAGTIQHKVLETPDVEDPVWRISIDDLRIFRDVFTNPLIFCHFLEERHKAYGSKMIDTVDEIDHFGLYMSMNCYVKQAEEAEGEVSRVFYGGFGDSIEEYYHARHEGGTPEPPRQDAPERLYEVLGVLSDQATPGRCAAASYLLGMCGETRDMLWSGVEDLLARLEANGVAPPMSVDGTDPISVFVERQSAPTWDSNHIQDIVYTCMLLAYDSSRASMKLQVDSSGNVSSVDYKRSYRDSLGAVKVSELSDQVERLRASRLAAAREVGVGRNDLCPCGSGIKYKKCCLRR